MDVRTPFLKKECGFLLKMRRSRGDFISIRIKHEDEKLSCSRGVGQVYFLSINYPEQYPLIITSSGQENKFPMTSNQKEPEQLRRGKDFHKKIQENWRKDAEGTVETEKFTIKPSGRKGRMDIFVRSDGNLVAVAEAKASNWDAMTPAAVKQSVSRHANQVWDYIESQLESGMEVSPGVIFPKRPKDADRLHLIEQSFEERGISVVWEDESMAERKNRSR